MLNKRVLVLNKTNLILKRPTCSIPSFICRSESFGIFTGYASLTYNYKFINKRYLKKTSKKRQYLLLQDSDIIVLIPHVDLIQEHQKFVCLTDLCLISTKIYN